MSSKSTSLTGNWRSFVERGFSESSGADLRDLDDVRYLLRYLNVSTPEEALAIVVRYFDEEHIPTKTRLALEELLCG